MVAGALLVLVHVLVGVMGAMSALICFLMVSRI